MNLRKNSSGHLLKTGSGRLANSCFVTESYPCFLLRDCHDDDNIIITDDDLASLNGRVVRIDGSDECWIISGLPDCSGSPSGITITDDYDSCLPCHTIECLNCLDDAAPESIWVDLTEANFGASVSGFDSCAECPLLNDTFEVPFLEWIPNIDSIYTGCRWRVILPICTESTLLPYAQITVIVNRFGSPSLWRISVVVDVGWDGGSWGHVWTLETMIEPDCYWDDITIPPNLGSVGPGDKITCQSQPGSNVYLYSSPPP